MSPNERPPGEDKRCSGRVFGPLLASHSLALRLGVMNSPALLSQGLEKHLAGDIGVFPLCHTRCFGVFSFALSPFVQFSSSLCGGTSGAFSFHLCSPVFTVALYHPKLPQKTSQFKCLVCPEECLRRGGCEVEKVAWLPASANIPN